MLAKPTLYLIGAGALLAAYAAYKIKDIGVADSAYYLGESIGSGAYNLVDGLIAPPVLAVGDAIGIPRTERDKCAECIAKGDTWGASFSCDATTFLKYMAGIK